MAVLIWLVSLAVYGAVGAVVGVALYLRMNDRDVYDPGFGAVVAAMFWPGGVWFLLALVLLARIERRRDLRAAAIAENERFMAMARKELEGL